MKKIAEITTNRGMTMEDIFELLKAEDLRTEYSNAGDEEVKICGVKTYYEDLYTKPTKNGIALYTK